MKNKQFRQLKEKYIALLRMLRKRKQDIKKEWDNSTGEDIARSRPFLAAVALGISLLLWVFVAWDGNMESTRSIEIPIQYTGLSPGYTMYDSDKTVHVRIIGKGNLLSRAELSEFRADVDLQNLQTGKYKLPIRIEVPSYLRMRSWTPSAATVEIYRLIERTVPVTWKLQGKLPAGKIVAVKEISPAEVTLSGPETDVMAIQSLEVTVTTNNLTQDTVLKLPVKTSDTAPMNEKVQIAPAEVNVAVALEDETIGEQIPVTVPISGEPADGLEIDIIKVIPEIITVRGRGDAVREMKSLDLPPIDVTGLEQNLQLMLPLRPDKPIEGLEIIGPRRARVEITLRRKVTAKTYSSVPINITGAAPGAEWSISPAAVSLTVEGSQLLVDTLFNSEPPCELYIDVSDIVTKRISLPVLVRKLQKEFEVVHIEPGQVTVAIIEPES